MLNIITYNYFNFIFYFQSYETTKGIQQLLVLKLQYTEIKKK